MISIVSAVKVVPTVLRSKLVAPMRPDRYWMIGEAALRQGVSAAIGFAVAAQRCPDRPGLIDELGVLTWRQLDERIDGLAAALQSLPAEQRRCIGVMCRNHRYFVESFVAAGRVGANVVLLNTTFAGPSLGGVLARENVDVVIYDKSPLGLSPGPTSTRSMNSRASTTSSPIT